MSTLDAITLGSSLDLGGLYKGFDDASAKMDSFLSGAASRLGSIPIGLSMSRSGSGAADAMAEQADGLREAFLPLGMQIKQALGSAAAPLHKFATNFAAQFEEVGPVVEKLAIRIDSAMRFPVFLERVDKLRKGLRSRFEDLATDTANSIDKGFNREADASKLISSAEKTRKRVQSVAKGIGDDFSYGLDPSRHVPKSGAFNQLLNSIDGFKTAGVKRMEAALDAVMNAKGKGSRKGRWAARDNAAAVASMQASRPAPQLSNGPIKAQVSAWDRLKPVIKAAVAVEAAGSAKIAELVRRDARDVDRLIGAWLGFKKVGNALSSLGSIAGATFAKVSGIKVPKLSLDTRQSAVLGGIGGAATKATSSFKNLVGTAAAAAGIFSASYVAVDFLKSGIKGASDLNETLSKTDVLLGAGSPKVKAFADEMASKFGIVKGVTLDAASGFAGIGRSLGGLKGDKLADFSVQTTKLAADLSSFANIDIKDAAEAINTTLAGNQSDKLKSLGVIVNDSTMEQYALAHGIAKVGGEFNEQQKFMIRSALVTRGLSAANGDLEATQDGAANQSRKLWGTIENLGTSIGSILLPAFNAGTKVLNEFAAIAYKAFEDNKGTITGWVDTAIGAFDWVAATVTHMPDAFNVARLVILEKLTNIGEAIAVLGPNVITIAGYIGDNWLLLIGDAFDATVVGLQNLWKNFQSVGESIFKWLQDPTQGFQVNWTPLLDGFKATAGRFPELLKPTYTDMSKQIADAAKPITDDVAARMAKRAAQVAPKARELADVDASSMTEKATKKSEGREAKTFAGAAELGTREFYTGLVNHANRANGLEETAKQSKRTADNTAAMAREIQGLRRDLNNRPKPVQMQIP